MRNTVSGIINGTGAAFYVCLGFVPDFVELRNLEDTDEAVLIWNKNMARSADMQEGMRYVASSGATQQVPLTKGLGIQPYYGGDTLTSANQTDVTYGGGIYLGWDRRDYRYSSSGTPAGDAVSSDIISWTLGSAANYTGNFNEDVNGTYIGEGSPIIIDGKIYAIVALTATQGEAANEVTLNQPAPSGEVQFIGPMYDMKPIALGEVTSAGFVLNATDVINVNDEMISFVAGVYDN